VDGRPVQLTFCLIGDSRTAADHLAGLARLARLACRSEFLDGLIAAQTGDDFMARLSRLEGE
jgi:mannitol/fructose-specific phosphotransferase system IIA component (Ntr-type)